MYKWVFISCAILALTACEETHQSSDWGAGDDCGASGYQNLVGRSLAAITFRDDMNVRIIAPDSAVTEDFVSGRMNIRVDENALITEVTCG